MVKKIVHIADVHIRTFRLHEEYKEVFKNFLSDLTELLKDYKKEEVRIVIAGDLVHQKIVISNEQLILGTWLIKNLEHIAPVIIIAGNHDLLENNKDRVDSITPMVQFLPDANVNFFKESLCYLDDNIVWCVYSIFQDNERPDIEFAKAEKIKKENRWKDEFKSIRDLPKDLVFEFIERIKKESRIIQQRAKDNPQWAKSFMDSIICPPASN
jgi:UDP-2,3-diacylglucosamine pyrophosphatase LpxH